MEIALKGTPEEIGKLLKIIGSERYQERVEVAMDGLAVGEAIAKSFSSDQYMEKLKVRQNESR